MARVDAVNLSMLHINGISSMAAGGNVSAKGNKEQFEKLFANASSSQGGKEADSKVPVSQKDFSARGKDFSKNGEYVSEVSDKMPAEGTNISDLQVVENEMKQVVKDVLGIDDAQLEETMAAMGIVITDLLNPDTLQQFVLQVTGGEEAVDFLTNEGLLQQYNDLFQALTDFVDQNSNDVMLLMEVLDTPVPFEEMLQDTTVGETVLQDSDSITVSDQDQMAAAVQTETHPANAEQESAAGMVESVSVQRGEAKPEQQVQSEQPEQPEQLVQQVSEKSTEQDLSGDSDNFSEEASSQKFMESAVLSAREEEPAPQPQNSVFAEQMNVVQGNVEQIIDVNVNGVQRMQQMVDIVNQVRDQIRSTVDVTATTMEMQLNPERLGKVLLTVSAKEGVMTANFKVQSEEAKQALESQMFQLRETLESKNLKVESVDVQISNFDFSQSNGAESQTREDYEKQGKKKFNFDVAEEEEDMEVSQETPEQTRRRVMLESGGSIDYSA